MFYIAQVQPDDDRLKSRNMSLYKALENLVVLTIPYITRNKQKLAFLEGICNVRRQRGVVCGYSYWIELTHETGFLIVLTP